MEDTSVTGAKRRNFAGKTNGKNNKWSNGGAGRNGSGDGENNDDDDVEECDAEAWETLSRSFREAQSALDQNRALIQQVNENHQSKIPDHMVKNVALIREINENISKVSSLYSNLSVNFGNIVHQRRGAPSKISKSNDKVESTGS